MPSLLLRRIRTERMHGREGMFGYIDCLLPLARVFFEALYILHVSHGNSGDDFLRLHILILMDVMMTANSHVKQISLTPRILALR
jgi:hypothetical protein